MYPPIIGITGKARVGKDTVAEFIQAETGGYLYSYAGPIKAMLKTGFGIDMADPYWQERKEEIIPAFGVSPRRMMQTLGTEWGRDLVNKDVWLLLAKQQLNFRGPGMIITDVRFQNEADWIHSMSGLIIHVVRPTATAVAAHSSESGVTLDTSRDALIQNDGTLDELQSRVHNLLDVLK